MARDHLTERADQRTVGGGSEPAPALVLPPSRLDRPLPWVTVELVANFYPLTGTGELVLYVSHQAGGEPELRSVSQRQLGPFLADLDVPDMAAMWIRQLAKVTDWPDLIGIAKHFRTMADRAREANRPTF